LEKNKKLLETPKEQNKTAGNIKATPNATALSNPKFWHQNLRGSGNVSTVANPFT
jgi:hypothetical protein